MTAEAEARYATTAHRAWSRVADVSAVCWIGLFAINLGADYGRLSLTAATETAVQYALWALLLVFLLDVALLYRWSNQGPLPFVRSNWLLVVTVVPWFRPLRLLRIGRGLRALRLLAGTRRAGALLNKARRLGGRVWRRVRD
jgi:hypothetical protein